MTPASIGAWLLGLVLSPARARKFALPGFILAALLALGGLWGAWQVFDHVNDRQAVKRAMAEQAQQESAAALAAERAANINATARDDALRAASRQTEQQLETIHAQDPAAAAAPASRGSRAVADRLR